MLCGGILRLKRNVNKRRRAKNHDFFLRKQFRGSPSFSSHQRGRPQVQGQIVLTGDPAILNQLRERLHRAWVMGLVEWDDVPIVPVADVEAGVKEIAHLLGVPIKVFDPPA